MNAIVLDENIPARLHISTSLPIVHVRELGNALSDTIVWERARSMSAVIVTKDADFSARMMVTSPPPWVVHLTFGNMRLNEYRTFIATAWPRVESLLPRHKLIRVDRQTIEAIEG